MAWVNTVSSASVVQYLSSVRRPPRTNTLGWARSDCHNCRATSCVCNRRRPRCDACTARGIICGGYVQSLKWQDPEQTNAPKSAEKAPDARFQDPKSVKKPVEYAFVQEHGVIQSKSKRGMAPTPSEREKQGEKQSAISKRHFDCFDEQHPPGRTALGTSYSLRVAGNPLPPSILEQLAFFTWRFSPVTLTYDIKANPWHTCLSQINHAPCLLYAIRALADRHRNHLENVPEQVSVLELKGKALSSFARSITSISIEVGISMSLLLMAIEFAESALGDWRVYLQGVLQIIDAAGGIRCGDDDMQLKVQIAQIVWYDVVIALLSRQGLVFSRRYAERVVFWKNEPHWSLFALNGFPDSAFMEMYDIANAAARAASLPQGYATSLETKLLIVQFNFEHETTDEETSALSECWRLGLLLYCTRVFHQGEAGTKRKARLLAIEILGLVHRLPSHSDKQKQAVMPLFLAACEMESSHFRQIAVDFCARWKSRTGIWINQTVIDITRTVWAAMDKAPDTDVWWGDFIDLESQASILFG